MKFGSDNQTGASQKVLEMINVANKGYTHGYGDDKWTKQAIDELKNVFEYDLEAYFVSTGTASNSLALSCIVQSWETILCHNYAHILIDESTAPEYFSGGARMIPISQGAEKLTTEHIEDYIELAGTELPHNPQARALSITHASESGLVYLPAEIKALSTISKDNGLRVHMDGARFANALASLECTPADLTWKSGVDVLSLGATKCGALCAEAVIFFDTELSEFLWEAGAEFYEWYLEALPTNTVIGDDDVFVRLVTSFATTDEQRIEFCEIIHRYFSES